MMNETDNRIFEVTPNDTGSVARILADAFAEDPVFIWALPNSATRRVDAVAFFTYYLRRSRTGERQVLATGDISAVAVMTTVPSAEDVRTAASGGLASLGFSSPAAAYFRWIESHRPSVRHRYLEFIGSVPGIRSKGQGTALLNHLLADADQQGMPVWCWSSNLRNITFYERLGFHVDADLRRDGETPAVTSLVRPPLQISA